MRRFLTILSILLGVFLIALVFLPWWFGIAARAIGRSQDLQFSRYERVGYSRFALNDVVFQRPGLKVTVDRLETNTPLVYLWRLRDKNAPATELGRWSVETTGDTKIPAVQASTPPAGWSPLADNLQKIVAQLDRWAPQVHAARGEVRWPMGKLAIGNIVWAHRKLRVQGVAFEDYVADLTLETPVAPAVWPLEIAVPDHQLRLAGEISPNRIQGDLSWAGQMAKLDLNFAGQGWKPVDGRVTATEWSLPASRLKLQDFLTVVQGDVELRWTSGRASIRAEMTGVPREKGAGQPPDASVKAEGDEDALTISALQIAFPGMQAQLTSPVTVNRQGRLLSAPSRFSFTADLARQRWFEARGSIAGEVQVKADREGNVQAEFSVAGENIGAAGETFSEMRAEGRYQGDLLTLSTLELAGGKEASVQASGTWNFQTRELVAGQVKGTTSAQRMRRFLPAGLDFAQADFSATAAGLWPDISHQGTLTAQSVQWPGLKPVETFLVEWKGIRSVIEAFTIKASAGASQLLAQGSATERTVEIKQFELSRNNAPQLTLASPAKLTLNPQWQLEGWSLAGPAGKFTAAMARTPAGQIDLAIENLSPAWIDDWVLLPNKDWRVVSLLLQGTWKEGAMIYTLQSDGRFNLGNDRAAQLSLRAKGDEAGTRVETLRISEGAGTIVDASGFLPVSFFPVETPFLRWDDTGKFTLKAITVPNEEFWKRFADLTGVQLSNPRVDLEIDGTRRSLKGRASIQASRIVMDPAKIERSLPAIEQLRVELSGDQSGIKIDTFSLQIEGQPVNATGELELVGDFWNELGQDAFAYAQQHGALRLEVPDAEVAVFTRFLPGVLSPVGRIQIDVQLEKGGRLQGGLKLSEAASRPLGPLGILQEIGADVRFDGHTVHLESVTAKSGGQPVTLTGSVELNPGAEPRYDVALKGQNIPFVRQMGLLLRGDIDLKLISPASGPPEVSGKARLRDSLFLADVRAFIPRGGGKSGSGRPPYFAIETEPLNAWRLNVDISGQRFLRLQTPVFTGIVSAKFKLGGTLGAPRAVGDATIDQGKVLMPFVSFTVNQGSVRLNESNPYEPALFVRGTARRYGYDLGFELTGTASRPGVIFTSSPALDSEQVLLMVMTGVAPSNEISSTTSQRAARIGAFLGQGLLDSVTGGGGDDRLSIVSGEKISRQGRETYDIEYGLNDRWKLTGEYDEFDDYNIGLKWLVLRDKRQDRPATEDSDEK